MTTLEDVLVKKALKALDWPMLQGHLETLQLDEAIVRALCDLIARESDLIQKYPSPQRAVARTAFFHSMSTFLDGKVGATAASAVEGEQKLIDQVEQGYHGILSLLQKSPIAELEPEARINAVVKRACFEFDAVQKQYEEATAGQKELNLLSSPRLPDGNGGSFSPDAVFTAIAETTAMAVVMESYKNKWFRDGVVEVPMLPAVPEQAVHGAVVNQLLAVNWRHWENTEKRRRFLGGELIEIRPPNMPEGAPTQWNLIFRYQPPENGFSDLEVYDLVANIRMQDRHEQNYLEMEFQARISEKAIGITGGAKPAPEEWVSGDEMHALVSLCQALHYDVLKDKTELAGLRLPDWVRGYAVLKEIARENTKSESGDGRYHLVLDHQTVLSALTACGLTQPKAARFVELTSLHKSARDMFDCPLIRIGSSNILVFTPALLHLNIVQTVLSNLSNRAVRLVRKGKAFEVAMLEFFEKQGLKVATFKAWRDGEEFEYDLIVAWQGHLFVFECKNRSLSFNDTVAAYRFHQDVQAAAHQVGRLADALVRYPDIIEKHLGDEYEDWTVVPCVLHSLPYSRAGMFEGAYFTDASALTRFFGEPYFSIQSPHRIGGNTVIDRIAIKKLWQGDRPTAIDFIEHLESPHQLMLAAKHLDVKSIGFELSAIVGATSLELYRTQYTTRSICEAVGCDPGSVDKTIAEHAQMAAEIRQKLQAEGRL
jgi:hypothetical protein